MGDTFAGDVVDEFRKAKIMGVRAGSEHRYTGVWVVVVDGRVFARSWNDKATGWFQAFRTEPRGTVQVDKLELPVRGKVVRSARLRDAVTVAFGEKYPTKGSRKWVRSSRFRCGPCMPPGPPNWPATPAMRRS